MIAARIVQPFIPLLLLTMLLTATCEGQHACGDSETPLLCGVYTGSDPYKLEGTSKQEFEKTARVLTKPDLRLRPGRYIVRADILQDRSEPLFNCGRDIKIDLGGHTVSGYVACNTDVNGFSIFNGKLVCDRADQDQNSGCVGVVADNPVAESPLRIHHLSIRNLRDAGDGSAFAVFLELGGVERSTLKEGAFAQIANLDVAVQSCPNCSRSGAVFIVSNQGSTVEIADSIFSSLPTSRACQGLNLYSGTGTKVTVHNNLFLFAENVTTESCRAINFDANRIPERDAAIALGNFIVNNNNRAIRCRSRRCVLESNVIKDSNVPIGAIHLYDQQEYFSEDYTGLIADNNTFLNMRGGYAFFAIGGKRGVVRNTHQIGGTAGTLAFIASGLAIQAPVQSVACKGDLATYTFAAKHNIETSENNGYGVRGSVSGTTGGGFDFSDVRFAGVPTPSTIAVKMKRCPSRTGDGGTLTTDADTELTLIDNDSFPQEGVRIQQALNSLVTVTSCTAKQGMEQQSSSPTCLVVRQ